jgi:hypothetical protein
MELAGVLMRPMRPHGPARPRSHSKIMRDSVRQCANALVEIKDANRALAEITDANRVLAAITGDPLWLDTADAPGLFPMPLLL